MKTTSKAIIWILAVFLTGVLFGGALTFVVYQPHRPPWANREARGGKSPDRLVEMISKKLELDEEQRKEFRRLLIESRDRYREAFRETRQNTRDKLRSILRPDQLERFDEVMAQAPEHHPLGRGKKQD